VVVTKVKIATLMSLPKVFLTSNTCLLYISQRYTLSSECINIKMRNDTTCDPCRDTTLKDK